MQKRTPCGTTCGTCEIGVRENDVDIVAPQLQRHLLEHPAALLANHPAHGRRTGKGNHVDFGMHYHRVAGIGSTGQNVQNPLRNPCRGKNFGNQRTTGNSRLEIRLQNHCVTQHQSRRHRPHGEKQGEVPWRNHANHAHRYTL
jgi:hypothetical protein